MEHEQRKRQLRRWQHISLTALLVAAAVIGLQQAGALRFLEGSALNQFFRHRPPEAPDPRIVLVTIEESDITRLRQSTLSDAVLAQVLQQIKQQQPRVIGLDLYRDLPVEPGYSELAAIFQSTPNLIGVQKAVGGTNGAAVAPPPALSKLGQVSASDVVVDDDGIVRRILLSLRDTQNQVILGFAARVTLDYLQADGIQLEVINADRQHLRLGKAEFLPLQPNAGGYVRADVGGYQILANFRRFRQDFTQVSITQLLQGQISPDLMRDRIVLIGSTADSSSDRLNVPRFNQRATGTPGVVVHADFISQLLSAAIEGRALLQTWAEPWEWGWIIVAAIGGSLLGWLLRSPQKAAIVTAVASGGIGLAAYILFLQGWWVPLIPPIVALISAAVLGKSFDLWQSLLRSNQHLEDYAQTLEQKVADRTQELREKNHQLHQEIHEHQQTEIALQKARDAAETANRAKSRFLATMSHELRTPLSTILGYAQLLLIDDALTADQKESIDIINTSGEHLLELLNDILTMSKIEAGRTTLNLTCFSLPALLDVLVQMFRYRVEPNGVALLLVPSDLPQFVIADEGKLRQVLINLLGNAVKFTQQGSITLRVRLQQGQSQPNPEIVLAQVCDLQFEVEDTGPGIAEAELGKLFQPFEQTETGRQSKQGTGLGLAICREFVQLMGGDISVRSQVAQGTVFRFYVPVQLAEIDEFLDDNLRPTQRLIGFDPEQPPRRILVVEDRVESRQLLVRRLETAGFVVRSTDRGETAIQLWEEWQPDLVLMDLQLTGMSGSEATQQIRQKEQRQGDRPADPTKILALTAHAFQEETAEILAAGFDELLLKPFKEAVLFERLAAHLNLRYE